MRSFRVYFDEEKLKFNVSKIRKYSKFLEISQFSWIPDLARVARENIINQLDIFLTRRFQSGSCVAHFFLAHLFFGRWAQARPAATSSKLIFFAQIKGLNRQKVNSLFKSISPLIFKMPFIWTWPWENSCSISVFYFSARLKILSNSDMSSQISFIFYRYMLRHF